jgi:hypothetical protein
MGTQNTKQILSDLYGLMMEINFHQEDEEVLKELREHPDLQIESHLLRIKQISAKLKAEANRRHFYKAKEQLLLLKQKGIEEIQRFITPQERVEYAPLFRKFEELTKQDEESILEDQELLKFLEILNKHIDNDFQN